MPIRIDVLLPVSLAKAFDVSTGFGMFGDNASDSDKAIAGVDGRAKVFLGGSRGENTGPRVPGKARNELALK